MINADKHGEKRNKKRKHEQELENEKIKPQKMYILYNFRILGIPVIFLRRTLSSRTCWRRTNQLSTRGGWSPEPPGCGFKVRGFVVFWALADFWCFGFVFWTRVGDPGGVDKIQHPRRRKNRNRIRSTKKRVDLDLNARQDCRCFKMEVWMG